MKKKNYEYKNVNNLTAREASHMYTWVLVKAFFIISLICALISAYVGFCAYIAIEGKVNNIFKQSESIEKYETDNMRDVYIDEGGYVIEGEPKFVY